MRDKPESRSGGALSVARAWMELVRVPNLFTVPGDPLAGYLLAAGAASSPDPRLVIAIGVSLLLYSAGTILNDVYDADVDRAERPARPIPAGRISRGAAHGVGLGLLLAGVALALLAGRMTAWVAGLLALFIWGYDAFFKKTSLLGPLALGACRSLNLVLGASLATGATPALYAGSIAISCYIVSVSFLARGEMIRRRRGWEAWLPGSMIIAALAALVRVTPVSGNMHLSMAGVLLAAFAVNAAAALHLRRGRPAATAIGWMIGALVLLQAALALGSGAQAWGLEVGACLLALWPVHITASRWFYAS